jgi:hypothetical protein
MTIAVAIPSIPCRPDLLARAISSVLTQTLLPDEISVAVDHSRQGAAATRNRAWRNTTAEWVAFLDDDDELGVDHLRHLHECAVETGADFVYPWYEVVGGGDPMPTHFGKPWDPDDPRQTTITGMWRREALEAIGGFPPPEENRLDTNGQRFGEDYSAVLALNDKGGRIVHLPERTWRWYHHSANTSGLPSRW